jgi:hypothetical protein
MKLSFSRRALLQGAAAFAITPQFARADDEPARTFDPQPGTWRNFEVTTTVQLLDPPSDATIWVPVPTVNTKWQRSLNGEITTTGKSTIETDPKSGAKFVIGQFPSGAASELKVTSRVQTMNRALDWHAEPEPPADRETPAMLQRWVQPTKLVPTDGIVRKTALQITRGAKKDIEKVYRIYNWCGGGYAAVQAFFCRRERLGAGPVDCRNNNEEAITCLEWSAGSPPNALNSNAAASAAMSWMGWRMVVNAGHT